MENIVDKIFAFVFVLVGLSHLLQPAAWLDFFAWLKSKTYGGFIVVIYTLPIAIVLVVFHNEWVLRPPVILTLAGWVMLVKCVIYAVYPAAFTRTATKGFSARSSVLAGITRIVIGTLLFADCFLF